MRTRDACRARAGTLRPRQSGAVRLRRVRRRQHERLGFLVLTRAKLSQSLDRAGQCELRAAEPFDEVAAAADAERLERAQLTVDRAVPTGNPLAAHAVARDDPLTLQQQLRKRTRVGPSGEELVGQRPATLRCGDSGGSLARETPWASALLLHRLIAAAGAQTASRRRSSPRPPTRDPREQAVQPRARDRSQRRGRTRTPRCVRACRGSCRGPRLPAVASPRDGRVQARPRGRRPRHDRGLLPPTRLRPKHRAGRADPD